MSKALNFKLSSDHLISREQMKKSNEKTLTVGHFFDFFFGSKQSKVFRDSLSPQALKGYRKGFFHLIPHSEKERGVMPKIGIILVEKENSSSYLECDITKNKNPKALTEEEFTKKYFPIEQSLSWIFLSAEELPTLPTFVVGTKVEDTAYRICEFQNNGQASQFVEATATGFKNLAARSLERDSTLLRVLSQTSEFQNVNGIRVLLFRMPQKGGSPEKAALAHCVWWCHENTVFYTAPPVQTYPKKEMERVLSGRIEKDPEYAKTLALLRIYLEHSSYLTKTTQTKKIKIEEFDQMIWRLPGTPRDALARRVASLFPRSITDTEATSFRFGVITPKPRGFRKFLGSGSAPKEIYAKYWTEMRKEETNIKELLASNSRLFAAKDRLQILLEAFSNGPPVGYGTVRYGPNIAASMLFFKNDFKGPLKPEEFFRKDEWKMVFANTLRIKYGDIKKEPYMSVKTYPYTTATKIFGVVGMIVHSEPSMIEYIWVWRDDLGIIFLNAIDKKNQTVGEDFLRLINLEKEKALLAVPKQNMEERKTLVEKIEFHLKRMQ